MGGIPRAQFPKGSRPPPAKEFANNNVNPRGNAAHRAALEIYLERFAAFFRRDFFVTKCFNKLNSEEKPEHAGFGKSCQRLYNVFRTEQGIDSRKESYLEYFYDDDMYMEFNVKHAAKFFVWLGIVKPDDEVYTMNPDKVENKNKDAAAQETKAAPEIAALETQTQFEVEIQALNKKNRRCHTVKEHVCHPFSYNRAKRPPKAPEGVKETGKIAWTNAEKVRKRARSGRTLGRNCRGTSRSDEVKRHV